MAGTPATPHRDTVGMAGLEPALSCPPDRRIRPPFPHPESVTVRVREALLQESNLYTRLVRPVLYQKVCKLLTLGTVAQSTQRESNPHNGPGKAVRYRYIMGALSFGGRPRAHGPPPNGLISSPRC